MNKDEFKVWLIDLGDQVPAVKSYLDNAGDAVKKVTSKWRERLVDVPYDDAINFTDRLVKGHIDPPKYNRDYYTIPTMVQNSSEAYKNIVREKASDKGRYKICMKCDHQYRYKKACPKCSSVDYNLIYHCLDCEDRGVTLIFNASAVEKVMQWARDGKPHGIDPIGPNRVSIKCDCITGQSRNNPEGTLNRRRDVVCTGLADCIPKLEERCRKSI